MKKNKVYCMDNLELLKDMKSESIDLIYSDILYNTGRDFGDFSDKLGTTTEAMQWYRPRIEEMNRVLKDTGTIYLQCDHRLSHYLKVMMDEIFGESNFRNDIIWNYGGQSRKTEISNKHDNILRYVKSNRAKYNTQYKPHTERSKREYRHMHNGEMCARTKRRMKDGTHKFYYSPLNKLGTNITSVWDDIGMLTSSSKERKSVGYQTQKPEKLLERIIGASSDEGDIVADFFSGSGTTGVVAKKMKRDYILCDINENAVEIAKRRIKEVE